MKNSAFYLIFLIVLFFSLSLAAQDVVVVNYMKVEQSKNNEYLEVEKQWKEIQVKKIEAGYMYSWQLWRKMFASENDPYQYITVDSYSDFSKTNENFPQGFFDGFKTDEEWSDLMIKTSESRKLANKTVFHLADRSENNKESKYILVNRMKAVPGAQQEYIELEKEIWKPMHEESIKNGFRTSWSLWTPWPFDMDENYILAVDGYEKFDQIGNNSVDFSKVHPELDPEETFEKTMKLRTHKSSEIWELVDSYQKEKE